MIEILTFKRPWGVAFAFTVAVCIVLYPFMSQADMDAEIDHLLRFIENADCTFIRNGEPHSSQDAGAHIRKKYTYIKRRIKTTEDFIRYAATQSSMSGQPYQVICDNEKMATAEWLARELDSLRRVTD